MTLKGFRAKLNVTILVVSGPRHPVSCKIRPNSDGTHKVAFTPEEVGWHRVHVRLDNKDIESELFLILKK